MVTETKTFESTNKKNSVSSKKRKTNYKQKSIGNNSGRQIQTAESPCICKFKMKFQCQAPDNHVVISIHMSLSRRMLFQFVPKQRSNASKITGTPPNNI